MYTYWALVMILVMFNDLEIQWHLPVLTIGLWSKDEAWFYIQGDTIFMRPIIFLGANLILNLTFLENYSTYHKVWTCIHVPQYHRTARWRLYGENWHLIFWHSDHLFLEYWLFWSNKDTLNEVNVFYLWGIHPTIKCK